MSVRSKLLVKFIILLLCIIFLFNCSSKILENNDLYNPDQIVKKLKTKISNKDKKMAELLYQDGIKFRNAAVKSENWGPATKSFGESALYYPRPIALKETAYTELRLWIIVYYYDKDQKVFKRCLKGVLDLYKSTLAANEVKNELMPEQINQINKLCKCINDYLQSGKSEFKCIPIE